jgi:hypothetical protein
MLASRSARRGLLLLAAALIAGAAIASSAGATKTDPPAADCQPLDGGPCLLPFPNNLFTRPDPTSPTGLRVDLPADAMPISSSGHRVSVAPYDRADGFSPGSAVILHVPGLDNATAFQRTGAAGLLDMARSRRKDQRIVIIDEQTGRRQVIWAELDANAATPGRRICWSMEPRTSPKGTPTWSRCATYETRTATSSARRNGSSVCDDNVRCRAARPRSGPATRASSPRSRAPGSPAITCTRRGTSRSPRGRM